MWKEVLSNAFAISTPALLLAVFLYGLLGLILVFCN